MIVMNETQTHSMNSVTNEKFSGLSSRAEQFADSYTKASVTETSEETRKIRNILVLTKPSTSSREALKFAAGLAAQFRCKMTILHTLIAGYPAIGPQDLLEKISTLGGINSTEIRAVFVRRGVTDYSTIINAARDESADLIIAPWDFFKQPVYFWQTSMMEKLIRHAYCPVLIISDKPVQHVSN